MTDRKTFDRGLEIRKAVAGEAYVNKKLSDAGSFDMPFQELVTEYCWGAVWGREELTLKTRSMLNLAMFPILTVMYVKLAKNEERDTIAEFGSAYTGYAKVVPAFFPRLARVFSPPATGDYRRGHGS